MSKTPTQVLMTAWGIFSVVVLGLVAQSYLRPPEGQTTQQRAGAEAVRPDATAAARRALTGSVVEGSMLRFEAYSGTVVVAVDEAFTLAWERSNCDTQRANMASLFERWQRQYETAHAVVLRSDSDREIGRAELSVWSGQRYHCGE